MREITPNRNALEGPLAKGLRNLASSSAHGAPPELGVALAVAFRGHHRRRRLIRRTSFIAVLVVLASVTFIARSMWDHSKPVPTANQGGSVTPTPAIAEQHLPESTGPRPQEIATAAKAIRPVMHQPNVRSIAKKNSRSSGTETYFALPAFDPAVPVSELQVVRVELPRNSLQLAGVPVPQIFSERKVLADFVVRRDGTPYAVRFVR